MKFKIQDSKFKIQNLCAALAFLIVGAFCLSISAQSNDQNFPTPVTTNEIGGTIKARDLGDGRSTTYFYAFNGNQGDIFVNVQTENFNGDIDIFTVEGLKSLTKIVVYADASDNETGRVVYLRKPERLLLRIEGLSPNDDAAKFRIKFAGSFAALTDADKVEVPAAPTIKSADDSDIKVNSVGTIINIKPKPTPAPKEVAVKEKPVEAVKEISVEKKSEKTVIAQTAKPDTRPETVVEQAPTAPKPEVVTENTAPASVEKKAEIAVVKEPEKTPATEKPTTEKAADEKPAAENKVLKEKPIKTATKAERKNAERKKATDEAAALKNSEAAKLAVALANLKLIIQFKDGTKTERPMTEVLKVGVDNGVLTVITKDGSIGRYSIVDVAKFTIE